MPSIKVEKVQKQKPMTTLAPSGHGLPANHYFSNQFGTDAKGFRLDDDAGIEVENGKLILTSTQQRTSVSFSFDKNWDTAEWPEDFTLSFEITFTDWGSNLENDFPQFEVQASALDNGQTITRSMTLHGSVDSDANAFSLGYGYSFTDDSSDQQASRLATNKGAGPYTVNITRKNKAVSFNVGQDDVLMFMLPGSMINFTFTLTGFGEADDEQPPGVQFMQVEVDNFRITDSKAAEQTTPSRDFVIFENDFSANTTGFIGTVSRSSNRLRVDKADGLWDMTFCHLEGLSSPLLLPSQPNWRLTFDLLPHASLWQVPDSNGDEQPGIVVWIDGEGSGRFASVWGNNVDPYIWHWTASDVDRNEGEHATFTTGSAIAVAITKSNGNLSISANGLTAVTTALATHTSISLSLTAAPDNRAVACYIDNFVLQNVLT